MHQTVECIQKAATSESLKKHSMHQTWCLHCDQEGILHRMQAHIHMLKFGRDKTLCHFFLLDNMQLHSGFQWLLGVMSA